MRLFGNGTFTHTRFVGPVNPLTKSWPNASRTWLRRLEFRTLFSLRCTKLPDDRRRGDSAGLHRENQLHPVLPVFPEQLPIHRLAEKRIDVTVTRPRSRTAQCQVLPLANARPQPDSEHEREGKARRGLARSEERRVGKECRS